jgi:tRNA G18 (ribose-2'-O)-methylase SpoU
MKKNKIYLCLENVRSAENVGSIFRTADAVGVGKIYLVGYTPSPIDRFGRQQKKIAKAALGAEKSVEFETVENTYEFIGKMSEKGIDIISVEQDPSSKNYRDIKVEGDTVFVFGNEVDGVSREILESSRSVAEIPMKGGKESLNVSVSVGVFLYQVLGV